MRDVGPVNEVQTLAGISEQLADSRVPAATGGNAGARTAWGQSEKVGDQIRRLYARERPRRGPRSLRPDRAEAILARAQTPVDGMAAIIALEAVAHGGSGNLRDPCQSVERDGYQLSTLGQKRGFVDRRTPFASRLDAAHPAC